MAESSPEKYQLGPIVEDDEVSEVLTVMKVDEKPLLETNQAIALSLMAFVILIIGGLVQIRIYRMLSSQASEGSATSINLLFWTNTVVNCLFYPILLIYITVKLFEFPMSNIVGVFGCHFFSQFLDVYIRIYSYCFPLMITLLRYLFVVHSMKVKAFGMARVVWFVIIISIILPVLMTFSFQYPVSDFIHGPVNYCIGRFKVYFIPNIKAEAKETYCDGSLKMAINTTGLTSFFLRTLNLSCRLSIYIFYVISMSIPEIILYPMTFQHISKHNKTAAISGMLNQEVLRNRKQRSIINIYMTFWTWIIQTLINALTIFFLYVIFGRFKFMQQFFAILNVGVNFALLPSLFVIMADEKFKSAISRKKYSDALKLLCSRGA